MKMNTTRSNCFQEELGEAKRITEGNSVNWHMAIEGGKTEDRN